MVSKPYTVDYVKNGHTLNRWNLHYNSKSESGAQITHSIYFSKKHTNHHDDTQFKAKNVKFKERLLD